VVSFDIDLPLDFPTSFQEGFKGSQNIKSFLLTDLQGKEIPYQRLSVMPDCIERTQYAVSGKATDGKVTRYTVAAEIDLPALGFTTILVKPSATPVRYLGTMRTGPDSAENEFLQIKINSNGTLKLTDKQTKQQYDDLLLLEDRSEIGDGWFHAEIVDDEIALSTATAAQVSVIHDGPKMVTFRMEVTLSIPARTERHSERRSVQRVNLQVVHKVSLRCGAKTVDVETSLDNTAEDHRLRLLLPTDAAEAATYVAHQPFAVTERNIALDQQTQTWQEMEIAEKPFLGFQAVGNANRGLAFISATGLHEGGVVDDKRRTMQVTLLRSFRRTVTTSGEPGGQEKGQHQFRYLLLPFAGTCPKNEILNLWEQVQAGICTRQSGKITSGYPAMQGTDPPEKSFVEQLDNRLSICAIKPGQTEDNLVIRLWNPHSQPHSERIKLYRPIKSATYRKLSEDIIADRTPVIEDLLLTVKAGPSEIITIAIEL
jgi:alpha-mannosidase